MDKLFGTSKKKVEEPKVDINAPTLAETSQRVKLKLELTVYRWIKEAKLCRQRLMSAMRN